MKTNIYIWCLLLPVLASHGADFDLGKHGTLSVMVPDGWSVSGVPAKNPDGTPLGYVFSFKPTNDVKAKCLFTFRYRPKSEPDKSAIRAEVARLNGPYVSQSVEKQIHLQDFSLEKGFGAYCVLTDASLVGKNVKPDEYKVMGNGLVQLSEDIQGVVSLFYDKADGKEFKAMVKIINSLMVTPKSVK